MWALMNTMGRNDQCQGRVVSVHRTEEAAERADAKLQRAVRRANGQQSYLPTRVVEVVGRVRRCDWIYASQVA